MNPINCPQKSMANRVLFFDLVRQKLRTLCLNKKTCLAIILTEKTQLSDDLLKSFISASTSDGSLSQASKRWHDVNKGIQ